jgi:hypothetical protein
VALLAAIRDSLHVEFEGLALPLVGDLFEDELTCSVCSVTENGGDCFAGSSPTFSGISPLRFIAVLAVRT